MAYVVDRTNNTLDPGWPLIITDGTINDTTTVLTLLGRGVRDYGDSTAENFVRLLDNSANDLPPGVVITGQLWFDTSVNVLRVWDGTTWVALEVADTTIKFFEYPTPGASTFGGYILDTVSTNRLISVQSPETIAAIDYNPATPANSEFPNGIGAGINLSQGNTGIYGQDDLKLGVDEGVNVVYVTNAGRIGIGESNPNSVLHITDTNPAITLTDDATSRNATITNNNGNLQVNALNGNITISNNTGNMILNSGTTSTSRIDLRINGANILNVLNTGVGIGTVTPETRLDVQSPSATDIRVRSGGVTNASLRLENNSQDWRLINSGGNLVFSTVSAGAATTHVVIDGTNGNVGIGPGTPAEALHIERAGTQRVRLRNSSLASGSYFDVEHTADNSSNVNYRAADEALLNLNALSTGGTNQALVRINRETNTTGQSGLIVHVGDGTVTDNHALVNNANSYVVADNGNFGVGTISPADKLHIEGTVRVSNAGKNYRLPISAGNAGEVLTTGGNSAAATWAPAPAPVFSQYHVVTSGNTFYSLTKTAVGVPHGFDGPAILSQLSFQCIDPDGEYLVGQEITPVSWQTQADADDFIQVWHVEILTHIRRTGSVRGLTRLSNSPFILDNSKWIYRLRQWR